MALLFLGFLTIRSAAPKNLVLDVAPYSAKVLLNGKTISIGSHYLKPGNYTVVASMEGFSTASQTFNISKGKAARIGLLLNPTSQVGYDYLSNHPKEQLHREALGGSNFSRQESSASRKTPLINELPFIDQYYKIDYGKSRQHPTNSSATAIYITLYGPNGKDQALEWIRFKGYDPNKLEIIYLTNEATGVE